MSTIDGPPKLKRSISCRYIRNDDGKIVCVECPRYFCCKCGEGTASMYSPCENKQCVDYNITIHDLIKRDMITPHNDIKE